MTIDRFADLTRAYGGIERWPAHLREEGHRMASDPACARFLTEAEALDRQLNSWTPLSASRDLRHAIVASSQRRWIMRARLWWSAISIGTALAGAAAGTASVSFIHAERVPPSFDATAFGQVSRSEG